MGFFSNKNSGDDFERTADMIDDVQASPSVDRDFDRVVLGGLASGDGQRGEYPPAGHGYPRS